MSVTRSLKKAGLFTVLTYGFSYLLIDAYLGLGRKGEFFDLLIVAAVYMFVPMLAAILVQKGVYREPIIEPLGISFRLNRWFLVAWLLPLAIVLATLGVSLLFPGVRYDPTMAGFFARPRPTLIPQQFAPLRAQAALAVHPFWIALTQGLVAGVTVNALVGFGEELGWRGLLQRELGFLGFWRMSAAIGVIWGLWHTPLILRGLNYPQHPVVGVFMMTAWTTLLSPIFSYVRLKARSVVAAAILHGTLNGTLGLAVVLIAGGNDLTVGATGLAGFIVLALANVGLFLYDRSRATNISAA